MLDWIDAHNRQLLLISLVLLAALLTAGRRL
jgi:hypothetical protein